MTMKSELDELERRAYAGTLSRDRDPLVPRGAVVAGEDRGMESGAGELEHVAVAWLRPGTDELVALAPIKGVESAPPSDEIYCAFLTYSAPAEERIRALEEERDRLTKANRTARELATARLERILEREARLEECRGVVGSAIVAAREGEGQPDTVRSNALDLLDLSTLSPTTRAWAEGGDHRPTEFRCLGECGSLLVRDRREEDPPPTCHVCGGETVREDT